MDEDIDTLLEQGLKENEEQKTVLNKEKQSELKERSRNVPSSSPSPHSRRSRTERSRSRDRHRRRSYRSPSRSISRHSRHHRSHRSRRDRDRDSERDRSRDRRRRRSISSHRSRSHSRRKRDRRDDPPKSKSIEKKENEAKEKKTEEKPTEKKSNSEERLERAKQRELMELTRDHRTVFVGQLQKKVEERDLYKFFREVGPVEHVLLIRDKFTSRSKGFAYVEMSNLDDIPKVLSLNGQVPTFQVFPILVKASEAEKNFTAKKEAEASAAYLQYLNGDDLGNNMPAGGYTSLSAASRIYCGNLHTNVTEDDLRVIFQAFGTVTSVNINRDEMGRSKGFGFIQFSTPKEANLALSKGNGIELAGNYLKLGCVNDSTTSMMNTTIAVPGGWKLEDDDEGAGYTLNALSRTQLMAKLAGGTGAEFLHEQKMKKQAMTSSANTNGSSSVKVPKSTTVTIPQNIEGTDSYCFVIKNMYDASTETGDNWHLEIEQDVQEECEKYAHVLHCHVAKHKPGGLVYILFNNVKGSRQAAEKLHGRWFNSKQIAVRFLSTHEYVGMFPQTRHLVQKVKENEGF